MKNIPIDAAELATMHHKELVARLVVSDPDAPVEIKCADGLVTLVLWTQGAGLATRDRLSGVRGYFKTVTFPEGEQG